jgi:mono/diheme cytochrome c family protein
MPKLIRVFLLSGVSASALSLVAPVTAATVRQGKTLYEQNCQICHGADGKGNGPGAAGLQSRPADLATKALWKSKGGEKMAEQAIRNGVGPMPAFNLSPDQIKSIIDYMSEAFGK